MIQHGHINVSKNTAVIQVFLLWQERVRQEFGFPPPLNGWGKVG